MCLLCPTTCGTLANPPAQYQDFCGGNQFRRYGYPYYALVRCDVVIPDPTDVAAWQALVTSGEIQISPCGKIDIPVPSFETSDDVNVCGGTTIMTTTYNLTFSTYQTGANLEDCYYYADLLNNYGQFRLIWFDCDGNVSMQGDYVDFVRGTSTTAPTKNPGFAFSISASPHPSEGDGKKVRWDVGLEIELDGAEIICPAQVPGLLEALIG